MPSYTIKLRRDFESAPARKFLKRGEEYRVPKEVPQAVAERLLTSGAAVKVLPKREVKKNESSAA